MTVRKNITLSDQVAQKLNELLDKEPWRKGNFSGLVDELLHKQLTSSSEKNEGEK
ncbi:MAG TPA: hypothetical protein PK624_13585 [Spirochaetota bacterium]|nr:hypothetical protein [Spirochaetota bacterium]HOF35042.1 hypothetical protein [Spirochaetota bacterium]HOR45820.1 hypothetical protein [Spirochaetota bacterium]HPJ16100.1 hypothetical protein [Spirochaetota bacterium]HPK57540.1 hypothetical protein [Spirochaetota bacterium]